MTLIVHPVETSDHMTDPESNKAAQNLLFPPTVMGKGKLGVGLSRGLLITFEGGEGVGKSTQAVTLAGRLSKLNLPGRLQREPGGTALGEYVRRWVKRESHTNVVAETMLFNAARAQLVRNVVQPLLESNWVVILDRFTDSTVAYQGYGRGMDIDDIKSMNRIATAGIQPDLTILLDLDPLVALQRSGFSHDLFDNSARRVDFADERRFEAEPAEFHHRVRDGYKLLAKERGRWCVIRADQAQHRVADAIWKRVRPLLINRGVDADLLVRK